MIVSSVGAHGFAWSESDGPIDLNMRLETHSGFGVTVTGARDVNERGQIAARVSIDADGNPLTTGDISVRAAVLTPLIDGDVNIDSVVDFNDLLVIAQNFAANDIHDWTMGDLTGDGITGFDDLLIVAQNYGHGTTPPEGAAFSTDWTLAQSLVPEPTMLSLAAVAAVLPRRRGPALHPC